MVGGLGVSGSAEREAEPLGAQFRAPTLPLEAEKESEKSCFVVSSKSASQPKSFLNNLIPDI